MGFMPSLTGVAMPKDRISFTHGFKVPGPVGYSSINMDISYTSDVKSDETPKTALRRVKRFVKANLKRERKTLETEIDQKYGD